MVVGGGNCKKVDPMSPWIFGPSVFGALVFPGWKIGGGICGGFVEGVRLTNEEDGSAIVARA